MKHIIWDQQDRVTKYVAHLVGEDEFLKPCAAIGLEKNGELIAGVVYDCFTGNSVSMHVASDKSKNWMISSYLYFCFAYPFIALKCNRVTGLVQENNIDALNFDLKLGFKQEGRLRAACSDGSDIIVLGMLKDECRFLQDKYYAAFIGYLRSTRPTSLGI